MTFLARVDGMGLLRRAAIKGAISAPPPWGMLDVVVWLGNLEIQRLETYQWIFQVPVKGGRDYITPKNAIYKWYILPIGGLYATYHPLKEPEKSIEQYYV